MFRLRGLRPQMNCYVSSFVICGAQMICCGSLSVIWTDDPLRFALRDLWGTDNLVLRFALRDLRGTVDLLRFALRDLWDTDDLYALSFVICVAQIICRALSFVICETQIICHVVQIVICAA